MAHADAEKPADRIKPIVIDASRAPVSGPAPPRQTVEALAGELRRQQRRFDRLRQVTERVNRGVRLDEILDFIFEEFRDIIPYNRIGYAAIDHEARRVVARWSHSDGPPAFPVGYWQPFNDTSLVALADAGRPRIINDLAAYAQEHAGSDVTRMLVGEGHRSSLTCPLVVDGRPIGFLFFDSQQPAVYSDVHVEFFVQVAGVISVAVERGRAVSELAEQKAVIERQNRDLADQNRRNRNELEMARKVQLALIPEALPQCPGMDMAMLYEPALPVGGDLLDAIPLGDDRMLVYIADAMGHGVPAALLMSVVHTAFHGAISNAQARGGPSPAALLREVNRTVIDLFQTNYVTAVCARIDLRDRLMTFSVAGHPPALLLRTAESRLERMSEGSIPLGIYRNVDYFDFQVPFDPGDALLLYTDGVIEAAAPDLSRYGLEALEGVFLAARGLSAQRTGERVRADLARHLAGASLDDDIAILVIRLACLG